MDRQRAEKLTILRATVGSEAHGLNLPGTDDHDEMGVCIEDVEDAICEPVFEQFIYRSAAEREQKHDAPSQPGDLDLTIYSLRKYLRLALQGNPTVLTLLFTKNVVRGDARGMRLQEMAPHIISRAAGKRYLGYLESQRMRLLGEKGQKKVNRPELEEKYGYDTKYAMHMLRLGVQGIELLTTGRITFPMPEGSRKWIRSVREGKVPLDEVLSTTGLYEREIKDLLDTSPLPEHPNTELVNSWMVGTYWDTWKARRLNLDLKVNQGGKVWN